MAISPAREAAYRILRRVESGRGIAVELLRGRDVSELKAVDRHLTTQLVMGVLRWAGELDSQIERLSGKPLRYFDSEVLTALRLGIFQIRFLEKIPKPAVVNEAVEMTKAARKGSAAGMVNAVLRKCLPPVRAFVRREAEAPDSACLEMALRSLPAWLIERWGRNYGQESAKLLAWHSAITPHTTLRVTRQGIDREALRRELEREGVTSLPGRYSPSALIVESGNAQGTAAVREGRAVIQDEASQLVAMLVLAIPGNSVLDICAAPGIKTAQLAETLSAGIIVSCDLSAGRLRTMKNLLRRSIPEGLTVHIVRLDATSELPFRLRFSRVLVDVPCSGTGTIARNPEIKLRLRPEDFLRLIEAQAKMLRNALKVVAPGGRLVYATCSLEPEENEQVVEKVLAEMPTYQLVGPETLGEEFPALVSLFDERGYFRTRPDLHSMDGFFAAVIVRKAQK